MDGLPVGSVFAFAWNALISMSFQLVGFLLTYLLHTTHAAKNGSRAGLGITLVQYGFYMRSGAHGPGSTNSAVDIGNSAFAPPADPNKHDFDHDPASNTAAASLADAAAYQATFSGSQPSRPGSFLGGGRDWVAYTLMIVGWFILIRALSDFYRARKHEQLVLQGPTIAGDFPAPPAEARSEPV